MRSNFFVYSFVATSKPKPLHSIKWITELACKPYPPSALPPNASTAWFAHKPSWIPGPSDPKTCRKELRRWMSLYPELCGIFVPPSFLRNKSPALFSFWKG